jgi:hypothetical protein
MDLSIEKGFVREKHAIQELEIKETKSKIDSDISNLRTVVISLLIIKMETIQWDLFRTLFPIFSAALTFSYLRFVS